MLVDHYTNKLGDDFFRGNFFSDKIQSILMFSSLVEYLIRGYRQSCYYHNIISFLEYSQTSFLEVA